ncbi:MAG: MBL fold metallo-hydrolase [Vicinamibacteria bacterium]
MTRQVRRRTKSPTINRRTFLTVTAGLALTSATGRAAGVEVEVLGTAQDAGLPHLGCSEDRCLRAFADPSLRKRVASIGIRAGGIRAGDSLFLVDATPDIVSQITDLQLGRDRGRRPLDGILLTHAHIGHYLGLAFLGKESIAADRVPVYCTESMADYLSQNGPWSLLVSSEQVVLRPMGGKVRLADNLEVEALEVPHREEFTDTIGFIFTGPKKSLLYIPDIDRWEELEPSIEKLAERVDILLLDGSFWDPGRELSARDPSKIPHPPMPETMRRLGPFADTRRIYFTHLNHTNPAWDKDSPERAKIEEAGFGIVEEGDRFEL